MGHLRNSLLLYHQAGFCRVNVFSGEARRVRVGKHGSGGIGSDSPSGMLTITAQNITLDETCARVNIEGRTGKYVLFEVKDTGTGMPQKIVNRISTRFTRPKKSAKARV